MYNRNILIYSLPLPAPADSRFGGPGQAGWRLGWMTAMLGIALFIFSASPLHGEIMEVPLAQLHGQYIEYNNTRHAHFELPIIPTEVYSVSIRLTGTRQARGTRLHRWIGPVFLPDLAD